MNMLEALKAITDDQNCWARPITWAGYRIAICYSTEENEFLNVPNCNGVEKAFLPNPEDIFVEWEIVKPSVVNQGR